MMKRNRGDLTRPWKYRRWKIKLKQNLIFFSVALWNMQSNTQIKLTPELCTAQFSPQICMGFL